MEDLFATGGLAPVLRGLQPLLDLEAMSVTGGSLGDRLASEAETPDLGIVKTLEKPLQPKGGLIALFGSLAPGGAILKRSAADSRLFEHEGRAVVFSSLEDLALRVDDPDLDVEPDDILVLQNAGPKSGTGMPEAGYLPIPGKLAKAGVKDMIRISDARMSGTAFGTIILHVTPEAALSGPLGSGSQRRPDQVERRTPFAGPPGERWRSFPPDVTPISHRPPRHGVMPVSTTTTCSRPIPAATSTFYAQPVSERRAVRLNGGGAGPCRYPPSPEPASLWSKVR